MISQCEGATHRVQIDVVDGVFADNKTVDPADLGRLETSMGVDFHLMVKDPISWVPECVDTGADRIIGQIEMMESQSKFVDEVQSKNLRVGLAINLDTPVSKIDQSLFSRLDVVLVMSVKAGFGGQEFDKRALSKIKELNKIRIEEKSPFRICVDGGETEDVVDDSYYDGADEVVVGRRLFRGNMAENIKNFKEASQNHEGR